MHQNDDCTDIDEHLQYRKDVGRNPALLNGICGRDGEDEVDHCDDPEQAGKQVTKKPRFVAGEEQHQQCECDQSTKRVKGPEYTPGEVRLIGRTLQQCLATATKGLSADTVRRLLIHRYFPPKMRRLRCGLGRL